MVVRFLNSGDSKLLVLPFKVPWWLDAGFLATSSLLWMGPSLWRWLLLLPGVLISRLCYIYPAYTSQGVDPSRDLKMAMCDLWPLTWLILAAPQAAPEAARDVDTMGAVVVDGEVIGRED